MNNFKKQLKEYEQLINSKINELLVYPDSDLSPLTEAMLYSLNIGGKRIRPIIMLEFYKLCGGNNSGIYNFAVALEMIHTYSLVHDDLPCMDNDDFRRGKPSCHKAFNEATAVLAGDALLTDAFRLAADTNIEQNCVIKAIKILAECAGVNGMIGGQIIDINNQDNEISLQKLKKLYVCYIHDNSNVPKILEKIKSVLKIDKIETVSIEPVFGVHVGIGAVGIASLEQY